MALDMTSYLLGRNRGGGGSAGVRYEVVEELPTTGQEGVIYLVPKTTSQQENVYNEYMYIDEEWELIGDTQADISGKQDTMQYSVMPTANASTVGKVIQYTGTTNNNYTNGYFYIGTTDGEDPATYSWENIEVQESNLLDYNIYFLDLGNVGGSVPTNTLNFIISLNLFDKTDDELKKTVFVNTNPGFQITKAFWFFSRQNGLTFMSDKWTSFTLSGNSTHVENSHTFKLYVKTNGASLQQSDWTAGQPQVLTTNYNYSSPYTPQYDGSPATKKYVDDQVGSINTILATLTTPSGGE